MPLRAGVEIKQQQKDQPLGWHLSLYWN